MGRDTAVWLTELLLGAAKALKEATGLVRMDTFAGTTGHFEIYGRAPDGSPIVTTDVWRLYVAALSSGQLGLMKIAATPDQNEALAREEGILRRLQEETKQADDEATGQGKWPYNFGGQFPAVVESFDAGGRFAMFLGFHPSIKSYKQFLPLSLAIMTDRFDLQTGVWLLGKSLRLLDFLYFVCGTTIGSIGAWNVLIETEQHAVFYPDFSAANEQASESDHLAEVSAAARMVWEACGGDDKNQPPHDPEIMTMAQYEEFVAFLRRMMEAPKPALEEHEDLYQMAEEIWGLERKADGAMKRVWRPYKTYPR